MNEKSSGDESTFESEIETASFASSVQNQIRTKTRSFAGDLNFPSEFGIEPVSAGKGFEISTGELRRRRKSRLDEKGGVMSLIDVDGVLRWQVDSEMAPSRRKSRRRRANNAGLRGEIVRQFVFEDLPENQIAGRLQRLDADLTPHQGLFQVTDESLADMQANFDVVNNASRWKRKSQLEKEMKHDFLKPGKPTGKKILLFVHGTFSSCEKVLQDIYMEPDGQTFMQDVWKQYDQVLAFNHPTVSISPILNAANLAQIFRASNAHIDVVCHSRGGLLTRWWREALDPMSNRAGKVIFAGSPLAGTGLAAPHRLKAALEVLTNISNVLSWSSKGAATFFPIAAPFGMAAGTIFSFFGKAFSFAANTPLVDAGVALVPGLNAQSRAGSNQEIIRLRSRFDGLAARTRTSQYLNNYFFIQSDFQTERAGWKFWKVFRKDKLADKTADMIFEGQNDLVVDTQSMTSLSDSISWNEIDDNNVLDFGTNDKVHHCNYFRQPETIAYIRDSLKIGMR